MLFKHQNFTLLWLAGLISSLGDYIIIIALPFFIYALTGSTTALGLMFIITTIPGIVLGSVCGVIADRWSTKKLMMFIDIGRSINLCFLFFVASKSDIWIIYTTGCIESIATQLYFPAKSRLLLGIIQQEEFIHANAIDTTTMNVVTIIGPLLGGALASLLGINWLISINVLSFLISSLAIFFIKSNNINSNTASKPTFVSQWKQGINFIKSNQKIKSLIGISSLVSLAQGFISTLMIIFVINILHKEEQHWGWMVTAQSIGSIIGGLITRFISQYIYLPHLIGLGLICMATTFMSILLVNSFILILILLVFLGIFVMTYFIAMQTLLQKEIPTEYRGRVFGLAKSLRSGALLSGIMISTFFGDSIDVVQLLSGVSIFYSLGACISLFFLQKNTPIFNRVAALDPYLEP